MVGLGNPGARYAATRHNVGFAVVDLLARSRGVSLARRKHDALCAEVAIDGCDVVLIEPQTYMNRSGTAVAAFVQETGVQPTEMLVVHDDLDLALGRIKLKRGGGTAGHRGLESIVEHLGTRDFDRLRIGIGRPAAGAEVVDFVLEPFSDEERKLIDERLEAAVDAVTAWCTLPLDVAMNRVNAPPAPTPPPAPREPA